MKSSGTGWVKLHRQILEWEWYDDQNVFRLFMYCLLKANHEDRKYKGTVVKRGTFLTSLERLSNDTGLSVRSVRTSLNKLESTHELTSERTTKGTVIQVVKYSDYQVATSESTDDRQTNDKQTTTTKNIKNIKKVFITPTLEEVTEYCKQRNNNVDPEKWHSFYSAKGWMVGKNKMKDWKASVRTWEKPTTTTKQRNVIDKSLAHQALNLPHVMERLLNNGWTREEIEQVYNGKHSGV